MRNISFLLTKPQILARTKTVTRRLTWESLKPGTLLRAVERGQGLKKGERVKPLTTIRVVSVRREPLMRLYESGYGDEECRKEGFGGMASNDFVAWFCKANRPCMPNWLVTRIEFEYVD